MFTCAVECGPRGSAEHVYLTATGEAQEAAWSMFTCDDRCGPRGSAESVYLRRQVRAQEQRGACLPAATGAGPRGGMGVFLRRQVQLPRALNIS
ncbi:hypothetical protein [Paenibacillus aestuarii]|nr:hypothetical protein [Paenibacillus aestuarii]